MWGVIFRLQLVYCIFRVGRYQRSLEYILSRFEKILTPSLSSMTVKPGKQNVWFRVETSFFVCKYNHKVKELKEKKTTTFTKFRVLIFFKFHDRIQYVRKYIHVKWFLVSILVKNIEKHGKYQKKDYYFILIIIFIK